MRLMPDLDDAAGDPDVLTEPVLLAEFWRITTRSENDILGVLSHFLLSSETFVY